MDHWKKQSIDSFVEEIKKYYLDCSEDSFPNQGIVDKINKEDCKYLNENLNLSQIVGVDSNLILNETLKNKEKRKFSNYILRSKTINLEVNHIDGEGKTVFIRLIENYFVDKNGVLLSSINFLLDRDYNIKEKDVKFVTDLYKNIKSQDQLEDWALLRFAVKLNDKQKYSLAYLKQKELFVILSLKMNKPIYFNFPNLLGIMNNALQFYRENGEIIIKAMACYEREHKIKELDYKKGNFRRKLAEFESNKPIQNKDLENLIVELFPELV
ncbi:MAG: hypothetical protein GZ091_12275 [Paludibacter sp.]|nr:hypothetical protein [Paludibacter sp.]